MSAEMCAPHGLIPSLIKVIIKNTTSKKVKSNKKAYKMCPD